ncbi:MAG TPA: ATP-binding protein [Thermoanaerobaculia bacterium]|nr:ATP-binding protein [Thermoanaerobaculia bacterium]
MSVWIAQLSQRLDFGVLMQDTDGSLRLANPRVLELLGRDAEALDDDWPQLAAAIEAQAGGDVWHQEDDHEVSLPVGRGGERRYHLEVVPVDDEDCMGQLLLLRDASQIDAAERDLWLASQMRSLSRLYRSMAHDLRAPLNSMVIHLELLSDSVADHGGGRPARYVRVLKEEMGRLNRLLLAFLAQSAPASKRVQRFDLVALADEMATFVGPQAAKQGTEVELRPDADRVLALGNADHVRQALLSLVVNALEAVAGRDGARIEIETGEDGRETWVTVSDNGPGIDPEVGDRIFEMHYTDKETGSGIGLAVARAIAERQGGTVTASERPGGGARFRLTLPAAPEEPQES